MHKLREITNQDHEWLVELHNDPIVLHNLTDPIPISIESHLKWWNNLDKNKNRRFIFSVNDNRIGVAKIYNIDYNNKNCVLGGDIHKDFRGLGHAKLLWTDLLEYCFEYLNLYRVSLTTAEYNNIAIKVYKDLGFLEEGRLKKSLLRNEVYYDQICMYMTMSNYKNKIYEK